MNDSSDRPHALLSEVDLDTQIDAVFSLALNEPTRKNKRAYADLLDERNYRASLSEGLPF